jgi:hypothetical protein
VYYLSYPCEKQDVWWVVYKVYPHELLHTPAHVAYHIDDGYVGEVYQEQELPISFVIKPGVALVNEVTNELAKLSSSRAMVPIGVFLQELHEPSILKALAKVTKMAKSSQETLPPSESITETPEVMEIYSDWCTSFMIYLRIGGLPEDKADH